jgi:hypothetical protein
MADSLLTRIARHGGGRLIEHAVGKIEAAGPKAKPALTGKLARQGGGKLIDHAARRIEADVPQAKPGLVGRIARFALFRVATRSVPGAILVTGGLLAKNLHDKRKARRVAEADADTNESESDLLQPEKAPALKSTKA